MTTPAATPTSLVLVRHGESVGNVAATRADREAAPVVDVATRDADTPLSDLGRAQAEALGVWLATLPSDEQPEVVWCSPYLRTLETATIALRTAGLDLTVRRDERLRDRELGILDRLTWRGVRDRYPEEAERRRHLGKMYHRPPGGESWADVALRLRAAVGDLAPRDADRRVLVVAHDAVVMLLRFALEELTEDELMAVVRERSVRNASVTRLDRVDGAWRLVAFDEVDHLAELDAPVTEHPGTGDSGG
ncbi:histidine phosphatase family protein [Cellulomonas xiejunii]|uniref:phosphoglycerate mutase (2,3-diphosphoglycerate-dependent) n=1 Tax=Cellulomonas xiejunii TaxID=2968083 RepID=A0ABY5KS59_9CELL|nr:histidine phosphatase family protein [Cellulomonas xiejunii]MCC2315087.1 histidine phosphatase family protein [Cellulomonas xiejunii]MCC2315708.1 histidine phosphatase family protein [Cellulomonas xiejunii]MCC2321772.1 histidine phosphatase family protein [Cellulomonas xiejunii]UUI73079.1 histidine phosphatase family protein [Cellulomonas xiejunii]